MTLEAVAPEEQAAEVDHMEPTGPEDPSSPHLVSDKAELLGKLTAMFPAVRLPLHARVAPLWQCSALVASLST
jgi:hypothetical protein